MTLIDSEINGNRTLGDNARGGGLGTNGGEITLIRTTVSGNSTSGESSDGGGVSTSNFRPAGSLLLVDSTVSGNRTTGFSGDGGGIHALTPATLINSTVSGNSTSGDNARGGGIVISQNSFGATTASPLTLISSTVTQNSTTSPLSSGGGGIASLFTTGGLLANITNSIVAGNTAYDARYSDLRPGPSGELTISHSLIGVADELNIAGNVGNLTGTVASPLNPQLGPLAFNGGPTQTHALLPGSPAIDAGSNVLAVDENGQPLAFDQRDETRVVDGDGNGSATVGIGAFELQTTTPTGTPPTVSSVVRDEGGVLARPDLLSRISVSFDVDVNLSPDDLIIRNDSLGGTVVDSSSLLFDYDATTFTVTADFSSLTLDPGFYTFELSDDIVSVGSNVSLDGDLDGIPGGVFIDSVYVALPGDANLDGQVDVLDDAFALVGNLGTTGGATWAQGDFNGDGNVNVLGDAFFLVGNLGQSVVPPSAATSSSQPLARVVITNEPTSFVAERKDDRSPAKTSLPSQQLALAGSQDIDAAFESTNLIDDGLF